MSKLPETVCKVVDHHWVKSEIITGYLVCERCCMTKEKPKEPQYGSLWGTQVIESEHIPKGKSYLVNGKLIKGK